MAKTLAQQVAARLGKGGRVSSDGTSWSWTREYPCGQISDRRDIEAPNQREAFKAILAWEDESDRKDRTLGACSTCFPVEAAGREGA